MAHKIALNFEDGVTRFVTAKAGETIADAAYRQGVNIPLDCRDGACGTCKARRQSGAYDPGVYLEEALSDEEAEQGFLLCCQARPQSDLAIDILASSAVCKVTAAEMQAEVVAVERLSANRIRLSIRGRGRELPAFLPGQYVNLSVPGTGARSYSFSTAPGAEIASFLIRHVPGGQMSSWLAAAARPGDMVTLRGPFGSFYLRETKRPVLLLAGGSGVAPILSMLEMMAANPADAPQATLVYGVREDEDLVEVDRVAALAARLPRLSWTTCCSSPASRRQWRGRVADHVSPHLVNGGDVDTYVCGPPGMVESARRRLSDLGVPPERLYSEKFTTAAEALAA